MNLLSKLLRFANSALVGISSLCLANNLNCLKIQISL